MLLIRPNNTTRLYIRHTVMRIAIFHSFMDNIGGAEIVTLTLARELHAHIYTTNLDTQHIIEMGFIDILPRIHSIGRVPIQAPFRHQLTSLRFWRLKLKKQYDFFIISGDWAMSGAVHNTPNIWYVHSPLHELWAFVDKIKSRIIPKWQVPLYEFWVKWNRKITLSCSKHINGWVCNSENTRQRILKYYKKNATIIFPPTYTSKYSPRAKENYWISVNRLLANKRIDMQLKAFSKLPNEKLIIVGSYEKGARQFESYRQYLESIKPANVEIRHWVPQDELIDLYSRSKGLIITSEQEDFGMTAIEAMASGKVVIAPNEGGYKETILNGKTGILINDINEDRLRNTILALEDNSLPQVTYSEKESLLQAQKYDVAVFIQHIRDKISSVKDTYKQQ
jgi:glycosyltransferase involved in cell wall biosynthesis